MHSKCIFLLTFLLIWDAAVVTADKRSADIILSSNYENNKCTGLHHPYSQDYSDKNKCHPNALQQASCVQIPFDSDFCVQIFKFNHCRGESTYIQETTYLGTEFNDRVRSFKFLRRGSKNCPVTRQFGTRLGKGGRRGGKRKHHHHHKHQQDRKYDYDYPVYGQRHNGIGNDDRYGYGRSPAWTYDDDYPPYSQRHIPVETDDAYASRSAWEWE